MNNGLKSCIGIAGLTCFALVLGLAGTSNAKFPQVIGNWEDSNDGWELNAEAAEGTKAHSYKGNATLGNYSYKVFVPSGWQKAVTRDISGEPNLLEALGNAKQIKIDITMVAKEWSIGTGWVKAIENIVISDDTGGWQQLDPVGGNDAIIWNGQADQTFTITFDIPPQSPPALTKGTITIISNYGDVNSAGNFYFDNVQLLGSTETAKPAEPAKPVEPPKASHPAKPSEPVKPAEPNKKPQFP
jgi:hypothetical protein